MPEYLVEKVQDATGIDIHGHWAGTDNFGILHTLEQHGNPLTEARRGQIAVEKEDFAKAPDVFLQPDEIKIAGATKRTNLPLIQFTKIMEDKKFVIKQVRTISSNKKRKVSRIVLHTRYKVKATK